MSKIINFNIEEFRGIENLAFRECGDINLIVGDNNTGKTSVLEAIYLMESLKNVNSLLQISKLRIPTGSFIMGRNAMFNAFVNMFKIRESKSTIFNEKKIFLTCDYEDKSKEFLLTGHIGNELKAESARENLKKGDSDGYISIESKFFEGKMLEKTIIGKQTKVREEPIKIEESEKLVLLGNKNNTRVKFMGATDHILGRKNISEAIREGIKDDVLRLLRVIDKDIYDFGVLENETGTGVSEVIFHKHLGVAPINIFGDGLRKILTLATNMATVKGGILLIDEIETSVHSKLLLEIFRWFVEASKKFGIQVFATTHSLETVAALSECANKNSDVNLQCYKIEKDHTKFIAKRYSEYELYEIVNMKGLDVR